MLKRRSFAALAAGLLLALALPFSAVAQGGKTFYWVSHGDPADPVWTYFLDGANQWATDTGNTVNTSFHSGDVPTQQEAVRAAIAAGADGIVTSSPDPGSLVEVAAEANAAGIPIININTPDPTATFDAYVGTNNVEVGRRWAQYLVDGGQVEARRLRLDAGRGPRRHLRRPGGGGHRQRLRAARHHLGGHRHHARPGRDHHPHVRLPARQPRQHRTP